MDEIDSVLAEVTARRDELATELRRRQTIEAGASDAALSREQGLTEALAKLDESALKEGLVLQRMRDEREVFIGARKRVRQVMQQVLRAVLALCTVLGFLLVSVVPDLGGWTIFGCLVLSAGSMWWLGDLADYLELDA